MDMMPNYEYYDTDYTEIDVTSYASYPIMIRNNERRERRSKQSQLARIARQDRQARRETSAMQLEHIENDVESNDDLSHNPYHDEFNPHEPYHNPYHDEIENNISENTLFRKEDNPYCPYELEEMQLKTVYLKHHRLYRNIPYNQLTLHKCVCGELLPKYILEDPDHVKHIKHVTTSRMHKHYLKYKFGTSKHDDYTPTEPTICKCCGKLIMNMKKHELTDKYMKYIKLVQEYEQTRADRI